MRNAICLLTWNRPYHTRITLSTLFKHNNLTDCLLLHADDGSDTNENLQLAKLYGFKTVWNPSYNRGIRLALSALWMAAQYHRADRILHLEHDIEFVKPIRWDIDAPCVRLYGEKKARSGPRAFAGRAIMGIKEPIEWRDYIEGWQIADRAHWGGQPSITKTELLLEALKNARTISTEYGAEMAAISRALITQTARPIENITWHIGV